MATVTKNQPILIVGAGIVGLTLAQALKKNNIPFLIFERDSSATSRNGHGWGVTIHWALEALKHCLPDSLFQRLDTAQVDPATGRNDNGRFLLLDLSTAKPRYVIQPSKRLRLNRKKFRALLLDGIDVQWSKTIDSFEVNDSGVEVTFRDGSTSQGRLLIGADGANSKTRQILCPETGNLYQLPVRFIGATVRYSVKEIEPLRAIDPLLFQGCHPDTGAFMWFSILSTPEVNGSAGSHEKEYYEGQIGLSWKVKEDGSNEVPTSDRERLEMLKQMARPFERRLRNAILVIPEGTEVMEIKIQDWSAVAWDSHDGKVTLIGDAAHAMTMYRGEAANYGITDAKLLLDALLSEESQIAAVAHYEEQMRMKAPDAVLLSRQASLDAHNLNELKDDSPLVAKRAVIRAPAITVNSS